MNRGKIVIVVMVLVGAGLASFAWWHRWQRSRPVLSRWGSQAADAIRRGDKVELFRIVPGGRPAASGAEAITVGDQTWLLLDRRDISRAAGLIHARHHLLHEQGFAWDAGADGGEPRWEFALRFTKGPVTATMLLDFSRQRARLWERDREASMRPIADALQTFVLDVTRADASAAAIPAAGPE